MNDSGIIELFNSRSEEALSEIEVKYGRLCRKIAREILGSEEDAEECVNTAYYKLWNAIPPKNPASLCGYLCAAVRNTAFDTCKGREVHTESFEELSEIISDKGSVESGIEAESLTAHINGFLKEIGSKNRDLFIARYYYGMGCGEIAERTGLSGEAVRARLYRIRGQLKTYLTERGVNL